MVVVVVLEDVVDVELEVVDDVEESAPLRTSLGGDVVDEEVSLSAVVEHAETTRIKANPMRPTRRRGIDFM